MLLLWALPLGILIGYLRGGRLKHLNQIQLRGVWLILIALVIQLLIFPLGAARRPIIDFGTAYFHLASYALLLMFVLLNRREWGILAMGVGMLLNLLVIAAHGGYMPSRPELLEAAGRPNAAERLCKDGIYGNNILGLEVMLRFTGLSSRTDGCAQPREASLWPLGDVFYAPAWVPFANVFSLGDLLLALGLILFLQAKMQSRERLPC